jgi:hypothetical protein
MPPLGFLTSPMRLIILWIYSLCSISKPIKLIGSHCIVEAVHQQTRIYIFIKRKLIHIITIEKSQCHQLILFHPLQQITKFTNTQATKSIPNYC